MYKDTGFQGYEPEGVQTFQPQKKPKGKELTPEQKEHNRLISSIRIVIEHSISQIPSDLVVQTQVIDIAEAILYLLRWFAVVQASGRHRKSTV